MTGSGSLEAFRAFDFEGNPRWRSYRDNLSIPPGRDVSATLERFKAKWYQREVDPDFDISLAGLSSATTSSQPRRAATPEATPSAAQPAQTQTKSNAARDTGSSLSSWRPTPQVILFFLHSALIVLGVTFMQPLNRKWSYYSWLYFLQTSALSSGYKVYLKHGLPSYRPFPAALKAWAGPVTNTTDFQYLMLSILFLGSRPIALVIVPITVLAIYHVFAFLSSKPRVTQSSLWQKYGLRAHQWLGSQQRKALLYNALAEIGIGFTSVLSLLSPPRNFLQPFLVFNFLRMRYWSPDAATYHRQAWGMVDQKAGPILCYVPILQGPLSYVQRWFQSMPGQ